MLLIQYDLFDEPDKREVKAMERALVEMQEKNEKLRKSLYCRHQHLNRKVDELKERLDILERGICQKK